MMYSYTSAIRISDADRPANGAPQPAPRGHCCAARSIIVVTHIQISLSHTYTTAWFGPPGARLHNIITRTD